MEKGVYIVEKGQLRGFMTEFEDRMKEKGLNEDDINNVIGKFYTNRIRVKYDNEQQDEMWDNIVNIARSPGGISYLINNMNYMPEFTHRRFKNLRSSAKK